MNNQNKNIFIWIAIFILMIFTFNALQGDGLGSGKEKLAFSDFLNKVDAKQVSSVKIQGRNLEGTLSDGSSFSTYAADYPGLIDKLNLNGVYIDVLPPDTKMNSIFSIFISWFPDVAANWGMGFLHASNARWKQRYGLWKI
jgi:cell division protease FtsH